MSYSAVPTAPPLNPTSPNTPPPSYEEATGIVSPEQVVIAQTSAQTPNNLEDEELQRKAVPPVTTQPQPQPIQPPMYTIPQTQPQPPPPNTSNEACLFCFWCNPDDCADCIYCLFCFSRRVAEGGHHSSCCNCCGDDCGLCSCNCDGCDCDGCDCDGCDCDGCDCDGCDCSGCDCGDCTIL